MLLLCQKLWKNRNCLNFLMFLQGEAVHFESDVMRGPSSIPDSIPTEGNIFHWIYFCFHVVKPVLDQ